MDMKYYGVAYVNTNNKDIKFPKRIETCYAEPDLLKLYKNL
jgi:hypothetical protein